jgi:hypothetical protein
VHHREDGVPMSRDLVVVGEAIVVEFHDDSGARSRREGGRGLSMEKRKLGMQLFCRPRDCGVNSARLVPLARRVSKCKSSALEVEPPTRAPVASFMREEEVGDQIVLQAARSWGK